MTHKFADITFTDSVKAAQLDYGSRPNNERLQTVAGPNDQLGPREAEFINLRDSCYLATVNETGWPYVQHRGGPAGFLKVPEYKARIESIVIIDVAAFDWNCPQHITPRFTESEFMQR